MQRSIVWKGMDYDTEEHCAVNFLDKGIMVRSEIEGWAGTKSVYAEYMVRLDVLWNVLEFEITFHINEVEHRYHMYCNAEREWTDSNRKEYPEFNGCSYIDITLTPLTNTLPVNGLRLYKDEAAEIDVVYIDVMSNEIRKDHQKYTCITKNSYRFENDKGNFTAELTLDDEGFVTHYPALFNMLKPI